ncbi:MAG: 4-alpha-glucanotransferase [Phycisphaerae bacterium]|nr:4-alpha-glucanotransferase [Phycisphaerae bacterium]
MRTRRSGILLHLSSVPGPHGIGDLGSGAERVLDWLVKSGQRAWQMLPVNPIGPGNSPYSSLSAFAGEPLFVSLEGLVRDGWLPRAALRAPTRLGRGSTDYEAARAFKWPRFLAAYIGFAEDRGDRTAEYRAFVRRNAAWLDDWCAFAAERDGGLRGFHAFLQFAFDRQWRAFRARALDQDVRLIGDVPIFVGLDSADVRMHPELFRLRKNGSPEVVTGVPPDDFSKTGQRWGQPHYRWSEHERTKFAWWVARFRRAIDLFDLVRIDHFIGFHNAYEVRSGARDARHGVWRPTPGTSLLTAIEQALGDLPLIAEDLGQVTSEVHALRDRFRLPGMRILQYAFYRESSRDLPCLHPRHSVTYPGTHDNDVSTGWWKLLPADAKSRFRRTVGSSRDPVWLSMLRLAQQSPAMLVFAQLQDALGLPPSTRMNRPGTSSGNWTWRAEAAMLTNSAARRLRELSVAAARV